MKFYSLWIALVCIVVFVIQQIISRFTDIFFLSEYALSMPWQFLTAIFLHGGIAHLAYNLFALIMFGLILEKLMGSKNFIYLFLISGVLANFISFFWFPNALGASGAIMAVIGAVAVLRPLMIVWAFNLPMPMFILAIIWAIGSVIGLFGFGERGIGYLAHLSGLIIGLIAGFFYRFRYSSYYAQKEEEKEESLVSNDYIRIWEDNNLKQ